MPTPLLLAPGFSDLPTALSCDSIITTKSNFILQLWSWWSKKELICPPKKEAKKKPKNPVYQNLWRKPQQRWNKVNGSSCVNNARQRFGPRYVMWWLGVSTNLKLYIPSTMKTQINLEPLFFVQIGPLGHYWKFLQFCFKYPTFEGLFSFFLWAKSFCIVLGQY